MLLASKVGRNLSFAQRNAKPLDACVEYCQMALDLMPSRAHDVQLEWVQSFVICFSLLFCCFVVLLFCYFVVLLFCCFVFCFFVVLFFCYFLLLCFVDLCSCCSCCSLLFFVVLVVLCCSCCFSLFLVVYCLHIRLKKTYPTTGTSV